VTGAVFAGQLGWPSLHHQAQRAQTPNILLTLLEMSQRSSHDPCAELLITMAIRRMKVLLTIGKNSDLIEPVQQGQSEESTIDTCPRLKAPEKSKIFT